MGTGVLSVHTCVQVCIPQGLAVLVHCQQSGETQGMQKEGEMLEFWRLRVLNFLC